MSYQVKDWFNSSSTTEKNIMKSIIDTGVIRAAPPNGPVLKTPAYLERPDWAPDFFISAGYVRENFYNPQDEVSNKSNWTIQPVQRMTFHHKRDPSLKVIVYYNREDLMTTIGGAYWEVLTRFGIGGHFKKNRFGHEDLDGLRGYIYANLTEQDLQKEGDQSYE